MRFERREIDNCRRCGIGRRMQYCRILRQRAGKARVAACGSSHRCERLFLLALVLQSWPEVIKERRSFCRRGIGRCNVGVVDGLELWILREKSRDRLLVRAREVRKTRVKRRVRIAAIGNGLIDRVLRCRIEDAGKSELLAQIVVA